MADDRKLRRSAAVEVLPDELASAIADFPDGLVAPVEGLLASIELDTAHRLLDSAVLDADGSSLQ